MGEADAVGKRAVGGGDGGIVLLDPCPHLGNEGVLQAGDVGSRRVGIGVLLVEIGADVGCQRCGLAHHLLPVVGPQPAVVVGARDAEMGRGHGATLCRRDPLRTAPRSSLGRLLAQSLGHFQFTSSSLAGVAVATA
jgi:hypothetical protein